MVCIRVDGKQRDAARRKSKMGAFRPPRPCDASRIVYCYVSLVSDCPHQRPGYCKWLNFLCGAPQHFGLSSNAPDFRLCCRTYISRGLPAFLYWNMQHHIEHHMFPAIPFFNLPKVTPCNRLRPSTGDRGPLEHLEGDVADSLQTARAIRLRSHLRIAEFSDKVKGS